MNQDKFSESLRKLYQDQKVWSKVADRLKKSIQNWRWTVLILGISGAVLETLATQVPNPQQSNISARLILSALGAIALSIVPLIWSTKLSKKSTQDWIRARSVSESFKKEIYFYRTGTGSYTIEKKDKELRTRSLKILDSVSDLQKYAAIIPEPSVEVPSLGMDLETYVQQRVKQQIDTYYRPKAEQMGKRLSIFRSIEFILSLLAAGLGAFVAILSSTSPIKDLPPENIGIWVAVITTISGAIATHIASAKYEYQVISFRATSERLETLYLEWADELKNNITPELKTDFVMRCENAISVENQSWMAEFLSSKKIT